MTVYTYDSNVRSKKWMASFVVSDVNGIKRRVSQGQAIDISDSDRADLSSIVVFTPGGSDMAPPEADYSPPTHHPPPPPPSEEDEMPLVYDIRKYGSVVSGASVDAAVLAAMEAGLGDNSSGCVIYIPPGDFHMSTEIDPPPGAAVSFLGAGHSLSTLRWTTDLGPGKFGINMPIGNGGRFIRHLGLIGPGGFTLGGTPNQMSAVRWSTGLVIDQCFIRSWKYGAFQWGDHQSILTSKIQNCMYGIYFPEGSPTTEDQFVMNTVMTSNARAAIGVAGDAQMFGEYIDVHFGFAPYGIYGESGTDELMQGVRLLRCPFEAIGNEAIHDVDSARAVVNTTIDESVTANQESAAPYRISGEPNAAWIDVGTVQGCRIDGSGTFRTPLAESCIKVKYAMNGTYWDRCSEAVENCIAANKPVVSGAGQIEVDNVLRWKGRTGHPIRLAGTVAKGDILRPSSGARAQRYPGSGPVLGVSQQAGNVDNVVIVVTEGQTNINVAADASPAAFSSLITDPTTPNVARDGSAPGIGYSMAAKANGQVAAVLQP